MSTEHSMSPMPLFLVGHETDELTSNSEEDGNQLQAHDTIYAVSNLRFRPCASLKSEIEAIAQLPSPPPSSFLVKDSAAFLYKSYPSLGEGS